MQISVSSTLTVYHDGQFWVGVAERVEDGRLSAARIVFGAEPSNEEVLRFVVERWQTLAFGGNQNSDKKPMARNPKRRQREAAKVLKQPVTSTKAQAAIAEQRDALKQESTRARRQARDETKRQRFEQRVEKRKEKKRGH